MTEMTVTCCICGEGEATEHEMCAACNEKGADYREMLAAIARIRARPATRAAFAREQWEARQERWEQRNPGGQW